LRDRSNKFTDIGTDDAVADGDADAAADAAADGGADGATNSSANSSAHDRITNIGTDTSADRPLCTHHHGHNVWQWRNPRCFH
jgi:hypothetical protein